MKLIQRYIDDNLQKGGYMYLDENIKGKIIKDIKCLSFSKLYSRIILLFYKEGLIDIPEDDAKRIEYLLNNLDLLNDNHRHFLNGYYARFDFSSKNKISSYGYLMCEDVVKNNNNIIYADTDCFYYLGDKINLFDIDIPVNEIQEFDYMVFDKVKKYISHDKKTNEFKVKGLFFDANKIYSRADEYISNIKQEIRNDKLGAILS